MPAPPSRIAFLDYLRIFAFTSVLAGHKFHPYFKAWADDASLPAVGRWLAALVLPFINAGGAGVVVFFLVSGYIITHVLQTEPAGSFLLRRVFRIYPLYLVAVLMHQALLASTGAAPAVSTLLPQLLLVGDFFGTPYALNGVEWTLRVELVFYFFMALLRAIKVLPDRHRLLPLIYAGVVLLAGLLAPLPAGETWAKGYISIYGPFLLLGSLFYLFEKNQTRAGWFLLVAGWVLVQQYLLLFQYHEKSIPAHFAAIGLAVFAGAWCMRRFLSPGPVVLLLSDLTYAVYLFHNWLFDFFKKFMARAKVALLNADVQALLLLLLFCWLMARYVEKPAVRLGRRVSARGR